MFKFQVKLIVLLLTVNQINKTRAESNDDLDCAENDGLFSAYLEKWTLTLNDREHSEASSSDRHAKVMQLSPTNGGYVQSNEITQSPQTERITESDAVSRNPISSTKVINNYQTPRPNVNKPTKPTMNEMATREVTETDLYLLGALEKLVYKVDFMEKRLKKLEEMFYYAVAGNKVDVASCPENFTRVGDDCYYFGYNKRFDWPVANKFCKRMGASLIEFANEKEKTNVFYYLINQSHLRGLDYWTSGLNPGLLWIWGTNAKPVLNSVNNANSTEIIYGNGRCLGVVYDNALRRYVYQGQDCSQKQAVICELPDKVTSNEISRIEKDFYKQKSYNRF